MLYLCVCVYVFSMRDPSSSFFSLLYRKKILSLYVQMNV